MDEDAKLLAAAGWFRPVPLGLSSTTKDGVQYCTIGKSLYRTRKNFPYVTSYRTLQIFSVPNCSIKTIPNFVPYHIATLRHNTRFYTQYYGRKCCSVHEFTHLARQSRQLEGRKLRETAFSRSCAQIFL